jgi:hypothetical protein
LQKKGQKSSRRDSKGRKKATLSLLFLFLEKKSWEQAQA